MGTRVTPVGDAIEIHGGTRSGDGGNLFHSFESFDVSAGQTASFLAAPNVQNILGRVTGGGTSTIDGLLQVAGSDANLFLMNPAGIVFGEGTRLDVVGDFTATTASGIGFADGWFAAAELAGSAELSGAPIALEFAGLSGAIVNFGTLAVGDSASANLLGGTVVQAGTLAGGEVNIAAVAAGSVLRLSVPGSVLGFEVETGRAIVAAGAAGAPNTASTPIALAELLAGGEALGATTIETIDGTVRLAGATIEPGDVAIAGDATIAAARIAIAAANDFELVADLQADGALTAIANFDSTTGGAFESGGYAIVAPGEVSVASRGDAIAGARQALPRQRFLLGPTGAVVEAAETATTTVSETPATETIAEAAAPAATPEETAAPAASPLSGLASGVVESVTESEAVGAASETVAETASAATAAVGEVAGAASETVGEAVAETPVAEAIEAVDTAIVETGAGEVVEAVSEVAMETVGATIETASEAVAASPVGEVVEAVTESPIGEATDAVSGAVTETLTEAVTDTIEAIAPDSAVGEIVETVVDDAVMSASSAVDRALTEPNAPPEGSVALAANATIGGDNTGSLSASATAAIQIGSPVADNPTALRSNDPVPSRAGSNSGVEIGGEIPAVPEAFARGGNLSESLAASRSVLNVRDVTPSDTTADLATDFAAAPTASLAPLPAIERAATIEFVRASVQADSSLNPNISSTTASQISRLDRADSPDALSRNLSQFDSLSGVMSFVNTNPFDLLELDAERSLEYSRYLGDGDLDGSVEATREAMAAVEAATGVRTGVSYLSLREDAIDIALLTAEGEPLTATVPVDRATVLATVDRYRRALTNSRTWRTGRYNDYAAQLYDWLIRPIAADLEANEIHTLMFSLDAGLRGVPIAALYDGDRYLIERYSVSVIPSIGLLDTRYQPLDPSAPVLAAGASTFADLAPLPAVPAELDALHRRRGGALLLDADFTRANVVTQRDRSGYPIVHLATHGEFNAGSLADSYIHLWDERIGLDNIRELGWNDPALELLVLSACRTALGSYEAELGFGGLAVAAGVKTAIASLWYVDDAATYMLMAQLYDHLATAPIKAEALRSAQLALIEGRVRIEDGLLYTDGTADPVPVPETLGALGDRDFSHPYFWSAFTAIGSPW